MDTYLQLTSVVLTGLLALERGAKHCGVLSRVRHCSLTCSKCLEVDMTRNPSSSGTHAPSSRRYEAPSPVAMMERRAPPGEGAGEVGGSGDSLFRPGKGG